MAVKNLNYSFLKGTRKVKYEDYKSLQNDLMNALGTKSKQHYYQKRKRIQNIPAQEKEAVEDVFKRYGITDPKEIWDITEVNDESAGTTIPS
ncbi:hypothetical protein [Parabacteroides sp.]|uniref:hypothetical protein n=1 Tax=Parabacteroides sp. TaxID=1869337 RepID=UPI003080CDBD